MSEPERPRITASIDVKENAGQVTGAEIGQHSQNVNVNVTRDAPPETQNATYRELQLMMLNAQQSTNSAIQHLEERFYEWRKANEKVRQIDDQDRRERQHETDQHRIEIMSRIDEIEDTVQNILTNIYVLRGVALGLAIVDLFLIGEFGHRLGWW